MEENGMMNITVLIAGRPYPLKIKDGEEETIRKIVKDVNEKINQFQLTYNKKDKQDCLSMALLTYAVDLNKAQNGEFNGPETSNENPQPDNKDLSDKIHQIDGLLDRLLT